MLKAMYSDRAWAQGWLAQLDPLRQPRAEVLELRAAGVSEARIQALYPPLDLREYSHGLNQALRNHEVLQRSTTTLLMSEASKLLALLPHVERERNDDEISALSNDLLDTIFALPEEDRPPRFRLHQASYITDLGGALDLCNELLSSLLVLGYIASGDATFEALTSTIDMRVHRHRLKRIVQDLVG
jgi:hypothetical protein